MTPSDQMLDIVQTVEDSDGQMSFGQLSTDLRHQVAMSNNLVFGRQNLTLNETKLTRFIIKQIVADDMEFSLYELSPADFARIVGNADVSNMYHHAKELCDGLMKKQLEVYDVDGGWTKINWVSVCKYHDRTKRMWIKLNSDLKPYLLGLVHKGYYTQYPFEHISEMSSSYAVRIFELILASIKTHTLPMNGTDVVLTKETILDACMLYKYDKKGEILVDPATKRPIERYPKISQIKEKVIEKACREICDKTSYYVPYKNELNPNKCVRYKKKGKEIIAFVFYVNMIYHEQSNHTSRRITVA